MVEMTKEEAATLLIPIQNDFKCFMESANRNGNNIHAALYEAYVKALDVAMDALNKSVGK